MGEETELNEIIALDDNVIEGLKIMSSLAASHQKEVSDDDLEAFDDAIEWIEQIPEIEEE